RVQEERAPEHEQHEHQPVRDDDDLIDLPPVRRVVRRHPLVEEFSQRTPPSRRRNDSRVRRISRARSQKLKKRATKPICTKPTTAIRNQMAAFIPWPPAPAPPKQTGQALAVWGNSVIPSAAR